MIKLSCLFNCALNINQNNKGYDFCLWREHLSVWLEATVYSRVMVTNLNQRAPVILTVKARSTGPIH